MLSILISIFYNHNHAARHNGVVAIDETKDCVSDAIRRFALQEGSLSLTSYSLERVGRWWF